MCICVKNSNFNEKDEIYNIIYTADILFCTENEDADSCECTGCRYNAESFEEAKKMIERR